MNPFYDPLKKSLMDQHPIKIIMIKLLFELTSRKFIGLMFIMFLSVKYKWPEWVAPTAFLSYIGVNVADRFLNKGGNNERKTDL